MSAADELELDVRADGPRTQLCAPGVGWFATPLRAGDSVAPGTIAGTLTTLGKRARLVVPEGVGGIVVSKPDARTHTPIGYGDVLFRVELGTEARFTALHKELASGKPGGALALRAPQSGRFYHRAAPGEPALCDVGRELQHGTPIGLIEVMKTFTQVVYRAEHGLPARARIKRVLARDGADVEEGAALIEVEAV